MFHRHIPAVVVCLTSHEVKVQLKPLDDPVHALPLFHVIDNCGRDPIVSCEATMFDEAVADVNALGLTTTDDAGLFPDAAEQPKNPQ